MANFFTSPFMPAFHRLFRFNQDTGSYKVWTSVLARSGSSHKDS